MVIQTRDRQLLQELAVMRVVDREQAKTIAGFRSTSRANVRLLALTHAGFLRRFFLGSRGVGRKALYALATKGAKFAEVPMRGPRRRSGELLIADYFVEHQLTINEVYCALKAGQLPPDIRFIRWLPFFAPLEGTRLIPDGYAELAMPLGVLAAFFEVDLGHESLSVWRQKIKQYLDYALSGRYAHAFGHAIFRVLVIAHSARRLLFLRDATAGVTRKLFWFASLDAFREQGVFAPIWYRAQVRTSHDLPAPLT